MIIMALALLITILSAIAFVLDIIALLKIINQKGLVWSKPPTTLIANCWKHGIIRVLVIVAVVSMACVFSARIDPSNIISQIISESSLKGLNDLITLGWNLFILVVTVTLSYIYIVVLANIESIAYVFKCVKQGLKVGTLTIIWLIVAMCLDVMHLILIIPIILI